MKLFLQLNKNYLKKDYDIIITYLLALDIEKCRNTKLNSLYDKKLKPTLKVSNALRK